MEKIVNVSSNLKWGLYWGGKKKSQKRLLYIRIDVLFFTWADHNLPPMQTIQLTKKCMPELKWTYILSFFCPFWRHNILYPFNFCNTISAWNIKISRQSSTHNKIAAILLNITPRDNSPILIPRTEVAKSPTTFNLHITIICFEGIIKICYILKYQKKSKEKRVDFDRNF